MLDKILYEEEVRQLANTYEQQFHYGIFYAYMRLRCGVRCGGACVCAGRCVWGGRCGAVRAVVCGWVVRGIWQRWRGPAGGRERLLWRWAKGSGLWRAADPFSAVLITVVVYCCCCACVCGCREQEIRNVMWISECVAQDQKGRVQDGIVFTF